MPALAAIIMRSKNEMPHVPRALEMLRLQTFSDYDFFAIDSGSSDGSAELLRSYCAPGNFLQIPPTDYMPGPVLNEAIARIDHSVIVLLNADAIPCSEDWLENLVRPVFDDTADAVFSRQLPRPDARFIVDYDYQRAFDPSRMAPDFFSAAACAFKRELWDRHRFHNHGYAEDTIWAGACRTFGARFHMVKESGVEHSHNYSLTGLYYKKFRQGWALARVDGHISSFGHRLFLCLRELARDFFFACRKGMFQTIPYNIAYRVTIHTGLHRGIREGSK